MATAAQLAANRRNAQSSTGPRSPEGKKHSAANATKFGLFSAENYVPPAARDEYELLTAALWRELAPVGTLEDMLAAEVLRCAWRLRRCAASEGSLVDLMQQHQHESSPLDPTLSPDGNRAQSSIDRARGQAQSCLRRAMSDLAARQNERLLRQQMLPPRIDPASLGLASVRQFAAALAASADLSPEPDRDETNLAFDRLVHELQAEHARTAADRLEKLRAQNEPNPPAASPAAENTERTQSEPPAHPRNAPCPCRSGQKYKRCCGRNAPAVLQTAA